MKVVLVNSGSYSSDHTVAVFSLDRLADAQRLADHLPEGQVVGTEDECYELNQSNLDELAARVPTGKTRFYCTEMGRDGTTCKYRPFERSLLDYDGKPLPQFWKLETNRRGKWKLHVETYCNSEEEITKIANELRTRILAGSEQPNGTFGVQAT